MSNKDYPTTKEIIYKLGIGTLLIGSILMPGLGIAAGYIHRSKRRSEWINSQKEWKRFNTTLLKRNLKRLQDQQIIEIVERDGSEVIKLTQKGHAKYLRFKLEELTFKGKSWDGKWRIVLYDINKLKRSAQDQFRSILKQIKFLPLQKSVYLTPYPCKEEIEYLKHYLNINEEVILIEVSRLENDKIYRDYFGI